MTRIYEKTSPSAIKTWENLRKRLVFIFAYLCYHVQGGKTQYRHSKSGGEVFSATITILHTKPKKYTMLSLFKINPPFHPFNRGKQCKKNAVTFLVEFLQSPRSVGSICQSSPFLTQKLVAPIATPKKGLVVDLGAGTGVVTEQLLKSGYPLSSIVAIEKSPVLSQVLQKKWPKLHVITAEATSALKMLRAPHGCTPVHTIISSLPLRVFSKEAVSTIMKEMRYLLPDDGCLIQYSYAFWMRYPLASYGFHPVSSSFVLGNIPPARVELYNNTKDRC